MKKEPALYTPERLQAFAGRVLVLLGVPEADARLTAHALLQADLEGVESHGISRLPIYAKRLREGRIRANPDIRIVRTGSVLKVDGDNGLGQVVSARAVEETIPLAREAGIAAAFVRGSNHFGAASYYCRIACEANLAMIAMTNSPPAIAPWGGKSPFFGTNPIAFGFPTGHGAPIIADLSSSVAARGKVILAKASDRSIPPGWAIDEDGYETTDPAKALRGTMLPIGGAKGYALAMSIEMLTGILSGAAFGPHVGSIYNDSDGEANVGHSFILLDISKWMDMETYLQETDRMIGEVTGSPRNADADRIYYPGERRQNEYARRKSQPLKLTEQTEAELLQLGSELGIPFE
ncbi:Ldh family oxidoreductase [Paenibacillus beijingensis]|uniref:Lactate dehydrogenase n=1 Tax=Paenibacillus beijingensis TaxID=1126833 RepID=A0A0D5NFQ7_9BACL|nr:Ldh family oxidoreductase [Paenibacillus beijingensis]AJY74199.1 lactate dehydrogenase [Paenibacillus beijingensis]